MNGINKLACLLFCFCLIFVFSACSLSNGTSNSVKQVGSFLKSFDGGKNWENKVKITENTNIGSANVLSAAVDPKNESIIYLGTEKDGLFVTRNGSENWEKLAFPLTKIYGLAVDKNDNQIVYASGVSNSRAKIYKSINGGKNWAEAYTEPANDSVISSLEISKKDPRVLYCGTSDGMIFKTIDGGQTWKNLFKASGPVIDISFDCENDNVVYFGISRGTLLRTLNGGEEINDIGKVTLSKISEGKMFSFNTYSVEIDPNNSGVLYIGTDSGMYRGSNFGDQWEEINILESSRKFPIRAIAINPSNSNEIIYSNSGVIYRSVNSGLTWFTFQLNTDKVVQVLRYDPFNTNNIYAGLRKI